MRFQSVYKSLLKEYGRQKWWPAESRFEIMVGAILTQNTSWENVVKALDNLKRANVLSPDIILQTELHDLAKWLRPSGYFNIKAERLRKFCYWYVRHGTYNGLKHLHSVKLRQMLLSVKGIGPETADDILLYAFNRKIFVIDSYTRRIFSRLGLVNESMNYESLRTIFEKELHTETTKLFNEFHALIVMHGKLFCKTRPNCKECCLQAGCKQKGVVA